ncbi:TlpA family protein disulfide reductase [Solitalea koreensis]|uniref:Thiol-disulfide isomerase or thioredoxin n=1 Tax=Solitalea koreensis TaxID=543615 RepID=A0A521AAS6_9SPHI|nr:TlpA disulfide reductase family protein [Solitalea koreensis]SMO31905.1 Thiol-disulfide isomerase or thioredoxin [Solitalea koreensis]
MKKYYAFFAFILSAVFSAKAQYTEINGVSKKSNPEPVRLFKVVYGRIEEIAKELPTANGAFTFKFQPEYKGYYAIGYGDKYEILDKYKIYAKGNDKINLELNDTTYVLTGSNTKENQVLADWYKLACMVERRSVYFSRSGRRMQGFFPELQNLVDKSQNWMDGKESGNADFDQLMKSTIDYDLAYFTMAFLITPRASKPNPNDYNAYAKNFNADKYLQNEELLKFPYGTTLLRSLIAFKSQDYYNSDWEKRVPEIPNDVLKGEFVLSKMAAVKSYTNYQELYTTYNKYFLSNDQKERLKNIEASLQKFKPGTAAINFNGWDASGKEISLSDFKGKIVLVDVWATWCGPCNKEIPYLKAVEQEFHGKDVVFMGVSVDEEKDKEKWKKFIVDHELEGVQLFAGGWHQSTIAKGYNINAIPRFLLFDRNGNIINVDAPRPSDPKLKQTLINLLNKS